VQSEDDLHEVLQGKTPVLAFDLDTYRLAIKHLLPGDKQVAKLIEFK
jgi:hypothetical protein